MKVVHLNAYDGNGGAGRACLRLNTALRNHGVDSELWVNFAFGRKEHVASFAGTFWQKAIRALKIKAEQALTKPRLKALKLPFSWPVFGRDVHDHTALKNADIIHLHWINHAFLTPENIGQLKTLGKPIVWTFHDSNAFTGGCHVRYTCDHFKHSCGKCPQLKKPSQKDLSRRIWNRKSAAYKGLAFPVIAPSSWMKTSVNQSSLLADRSVEVIPNTLETDIFHPSQRVISERFIMLTGFMPTRQDSHKGTGYLLEALNLFATMPGVEPQQVELRIFGNRQPVKLNSPFRITFMGVIRNDEQLAITYASSDVFLAPSLEDNLPYTVMESLACGTPVVAFTTGGIPDMVKHQQNGYLAEYRSAEDLARGMYWVYQQKNRDKIRQNARESIMAGFSEQVIAERHIALYRKILEGRNA